MFNPNSPAASPLGKHTEYRDQYSPDLLFKIPRQLKRDELMIQENHLPFFGVDLWTAYEFSWLNLKGKPNIALLFIQIPANSPYLIESKSLKLYLNSFNQTQINSPETILAQITFDLSEAAGAPVSVEIKTAEHFKHQRIEEFKSTNIDHLDIQIEHYQPRPELLKTSNHIIEESIYSNLLKSNCLVTQQPDWGSIEIKYRGRAIQHESLLKYIISFRQHHEFHEQCVERIFCDLLNYCEPEYLTVYARYTRRGGLDINPWRSNDIQNNMPENIRNARQ